ncbi:MAG: hypothetical protein WCS11_04330 [Dysgonamonadaceae bacterium]|nr:hypothetical protein [Dysgonamonadaceae bacterium]MDD3727013.1 hypothetical protein [Dysgonamonadaceae bacterium]MDD4606655.1 hypothetical protein [Dysgonamonadaceae bacterium]HUI33275.1 hypothetical protein [Dysgonamonadaceae bacterium]
MKTAPMNYKIKRLALSLLLDAVGCISFAIPLIGDFSDIIWAPIAAIISYKMFGEKRGKFTALTTFTEEILPFTDIIPSFTIFCILFDWIGIGNPKKTLILQTK